MRCAVPGFGEGLVALLQSLGQAFVDLNQCSSVIVAAEFDESWIAMRQHANQRWTEAFALLLAFKRREGHCRVPRHHIERGFRLGQWVAVQRYWHRIHRLVAERERRLNAVRFVWSRRDWLWERAFTTLEKFKKREGHCLVHTLYVEDGINLGSWVTVQRREKSKMSRVRKRRLDKLGFIWVGMMPREVMRGLRRQMAR